MFLIFDNKQKQNSGGIAIFVFGNFIFQCYLNCFPAVMAVIGLTKAIWKLGIFRSSKRYLIFHIGKKNLTISKTVYNTNDPIIYSKTKASKMSTADTFRLVPNPAVLPIERYVILGSIIVLLVYAAVLRKENKLDRILDGSFDYAEDDEVKVLNALLHAKFQGLKTEELEKKLQMIREQKKKK